MMRRSVAVALGLIFTLAAGLAAFSGGAVMALFGSNGTLTSDPEHLSTPTTALVTTVADVDGTAGSARSGGRKHRGGERPELRPVPARQGTSGVDLNARLGVTLPHLHGIGTGVLIGGLAGVLSGVVLFLTGLRMPNAKDQYRQTATDRPVGHAHPAGEESRTQPCG